MYIREKEFWNWFTQNKTVFENVILNSSEIEQEEIDQILNNFEHQLHNYDENLWFRMGGEQPFELIITAEGNVDKFDNVLSLVNQSGNIENWKIISFIQPQDISKFTYETDSFELTEKDVFFSFAENISGEDGYYLETMFYVTDEKFIEDINFKSSIIRIAETSIGEYDFSKIIGFIDVTKKSNNYLLHQNGQFSIGELPEIVKNLKEKIFI